MHVKDHLIPSVQFLVFIILLTEIFHLSSHKGETIPWDLDDPHEPIHENM